MPIQQMFLGTADSDKTYIEDIFRMMQYEGTDTGSSGWSNDVVNNIDYAGEGGMLLAKGRFNTGSAATSFHMWDTERGIQNQLVPNSQNAALNPSGNYGLKSFSSNGVNLGQNYNSENWHAYTYMTWGWRKAPGFFDIQKWTGNGTDNRVITHDLGCVPGCIMIKSIDANYGWYVYHRNLNGGTTPEQYFLRLDTSDAEATSTGLTDEAPTATQFKLGDNVFTNKDGDEYIAYIFAGGESTAATATSVKFTIANDGLTIADHADFNVGSGDFTMEMWYRPTVDDVAGRTLGQSNSTWTDGTGPMIEMDGGEAKLYMKDTSNSWIAAGHSMGKTYAGQWHHLAVSRTGNSLKGFNNGIEQFEITTSATVMDVTGDFGIGTNAAGTGVPSGSISNVRFVKGQGLYTSTFSPSLEPLTTTSQGATASNVKLLCCQGSTLTAATVTPGTITSTNNVNNSWSSDSPFDDSGGFKFGDKGNQNVIKCSSYTGNGSSTGPEINLGWEPQWLLIRRTASEGWIMIDSLRGMFEDQNDPYFELNWGLAENTGKELVSLTATGFKVRTTDQTVNSDGSNYLYIAIRRPDGYVGKPAEAGTDVFAMSTAASAVPRYNAGFPVDWAFKRRPATAETWYTGARLLGESRGYLDAYTAFSNNSSFVWDNHTHWPGGGGDDANVYLAWMFKRAPLFFDVVVYKGTGSLHKVRHNLGQKPEMIIVKNMPSSNYNDWRVYHSGVNGGTNPEEYSLKLNSNGSQDDNSSMWGDTAPTALDFTVKDYSDTNNNNEMHLALLFGSVPGVSKVGTYQGTSPLAARVITTGFQPRFVLIKNVTSGGHWIECNSVNGFTKGMKLSDSAVMFTDDIVSVQSTGFTVTTTAGTVTNNNNDDHYIYLAIA